MPDIPTGSQVFDLAFHPTNSVVYTGLLTGEIKAFSYDEQGAYKQEFSARPSKRSCRGLALNPDGDRLWAVGKGRSIFALDSETFKLVETRADAHQAAINKVKHIMPNMVVTGDDSGAIKLWDPRSTDVLREYNHHSDFISDFHWLEDKKQLVATSGDGTLSVLDVRSKKTEPLAQSEDQEDELLSIVPIKDGSKIIVGTQLGVLSVFDRKKGWADCVDRVPGHPSSIDALCRLPSSYPSSHSTILTGSSDGMLRVVQLFPTKLIGVIADHGEFPIEKIAIDMAGQGRWVGSVGHEEFLKMTDLKDIFEDEDAEDEGEGDESGVKSDAEEEHDSEASEEEGKDVSSSEEEQVPVERKRKRKPEKNQLAGKSKKGRNQIDTDPKFFSDL